jgi:tRNA U34 5-methylaminomethyl-2-thiouridine-forming methyltransferase MnmC
MHIGTNPRTEALELHVAQQRLKERVQEWNRSEPFVIWDIGLGPAGNAITAIESIRESGVPIEIHSYEISTEVLEFALEHAGELEYLAGWESTIRELLDRGITHPAESITWRLHRGDFSRQPHEAPAPSVIFFDPYSPARNSEMWNLETFRSMWNAVSAPNSPPCTMTNYTRSTSVRVTMLLAGWFVGTGVPTGEKEVTTIASNRLELLKEPLDAVWLARVRSSTNAEPMRGRNNERGPISAEDYARLITHPQFQRQH